MARNVSSVGKSLNRGYQIQFDSDVDFEYIMSLIKQIF